MDPFRLRHERLFDDWAIVGSSRKHKFGGGVVLLVRRRGGRVDLRWSGGAQERGAEVACLRGTYKGQTISVIAAYVTPNRDICDSGSQKLRSATLAAISRLVQSASDRGDKVILLGDLNIGFTKTQIQDLDNSLHNARISPDFENSAASFTTAASKEEFTIVKGWKLTLRNGLWSDSGASTHEKTCHLLDQVWMSSDLQGSNVRTVTIPKSNKTDKALSDHYPLVAQWSPFTSDDSVEKNNAQTTKKGTCFDEWDDFDRSRFNHEFGQRIKKLKTSRSIDACGEALVEAAKIVEDERIAAKPKHSKSSQFWNEELRNARKTVRKLRNIDRSSKERKVAASTLKMLIDHRTIEIMQQTSVRWAAGLKAESRTSWRSVKTQKLLSVTGLPKPQECTLQVGSLTSYDGPPSWFTVLTLRTKWLRTLAG